MKTKDEGKDNSRIAPTNLWLEIFMQKIKLTLFYYENLYDIYKKEKNVLKLFSLDTDECKKEKETAFKEYENLKQKVRDLKEKLKQQSGEQQLQLSEEILKYQSQQLRELNNIEYNEKRKTDYEMSQFLSAITELAYELKSFANLFGERDKAIEQELARVKPIIYPELGEKGMRVYKTILSLTNLIFSRKRTNIII